MDDDINKIKPINKISKKLILKIFLVIIVFIYFFLSAPFSSKDIVIHISNGESISSITSKLKTENAIRNEFSLKFFIKLLKRGTGVVSGDYLIKKNSPVWIIAWQIGRGNHGISPVRITIREGLTNIQIADLLASKLSGFRRDLFLEETNDKQGYLFPDTYFFFPLDTTDEIILKLSNNFDIRTKKISTQTKLSNKDFSDILIMASILEGEASGKDDVGIISGILWKRISLNMSLGVDVDKSTYTQKGLPLKPLNNPGLISIDAALNPISSPYLYYLHDKNGNVHYATSFEEHKININNYLK